MHDTATSTSPTDQAMRPTVSREDASRRAIDGGVEDGRDVVQVGHRLLAVPEQELRLGEGGAQHRPGDGRRRRKGLDRRPDQLPGRGRVPLRRHQAGSQRGALGRIPQQRAELTRVTEHPLGGIAVAEAKVGLGVTEHGSRTHDLGRVVVAGWLQRRHCTRRQLAAEHQQGVGQVASRSAGPPAHDAPRRLHRLAAVPAGERGVGEQRVEQRALPARRQRRGLAQLGNRCRVTVQPPHGGAACHVDGHPTIGAIGHQLAHATRITERRPAAQRPHE